MRGLGSCLQIDCIYFNKFPMPIINQLRAQLMLQTVKTFINSPDFWRWHGFVLSILWLFGSSIGIALKKKDLKYHALSFLIVDYVSLFFMGSALYLLLPKLHLFMGWSLAEKVHIIGGLGFMGLMIWQHVGGAISWHKEESNLGHRKLGKRLEIFGRILAGIGWLVHESDRNYAIAVFGVSLLMYALAERASWSKIKTK